MLSRYRQTRFAAEVFTELINDGLTRRGDANVIHVYNNQTVLAVEETRILFSLLESKGLEGLDHVLIPQFWCGRYSVKTFNQLQACWLVSVGGKTPRQVNPNGFLQGCLYKCLVEVDDTGLPFVDYRKNQHEAN